MRPLFVAGCQRTGTTAFTEYMNSHPEVLICRERYKYMPLEVTFDHFSFERILDYSEAETNVPEEQYAELLTRKDPAELKWIGDKNPDYYKHFARLLEQNPGARFIVMHRPVEEVAESFEARAKNPEDHWPTHYDFELAVKLWNLALNNIREFVQNEPEANVLILDYHDFFRRTETCVPLISRFLEIEFPDPVLADWRERSAGFEGARRRKKPPTEEQASFIRQNKDYAAEEWLLGRIEEQRSNPEILAAQGSTQPVRSPRTPRPPDKSARIKELRGSLAQERRRVRHLRGKNHELTSKIQDLERRLREIQSARSWRLLQSLGRFRRNPPGK